MDATNSMSMTQTAQNQSSAAVIEEFAIQTSNYAAEFGQAGGRFYNVTMKSGTNAFHGTAHDYIINEALNASQSYGGTKNRVGRSCMAEKSGFCFANFSCRLHEPIGRGRGG
jgi:hypothetical protein